MFHFDNGAVAKVNIGFPFVYKAAYNDRARGNEGSWSEVENCARVFIDYGLTGPCVRVGDRRGRSAPAARNEEGALERVLTADARGHGFTIRNTREK